MVWIDSGFNWDAASEIDLAFLVSALFGSSGRVAHVSDCRRGDSVDT